MPAPKGENHPYNRLQKQFYDKADECRELQKELAETRQMAVFESNLHYTTKKDLADVRVRLHEQVAKHTGYVEGVNDCIKLLLRCDEARKGMGLSALFG